MVTIWAQITLNAATSWSLQAYAKFLQDQPRVYMSRTPADHVTMRYFGNLDHFRREALVHFFKKQKTYASDFVIMLEDHVEVLDEPCLPVVVPIKGHLERMSNLRTHLDRVATDVGLPAADYELYPHVTVGYARLDPHGQLNTREKLQSYLQQSGFRDIVRTQEVNTIELTSSGRVDPLAQWTFKS